MKEYGVGDVLAKVFEHVRCPEDAWRVAAQLVGRDARGVGDGVPNCRLVRTTIRALPAVLIVVVRPVRCGDELLLNYGQDYWG